MHGARDWRVSLKAASKLSELVAQLLVFLRVLFHDLFNLHPLAFFRLQVMFLALQLLSEVCYSLLVLHILFMFNTFGRGRYLLEEKNL